LLLGHNSVDRAGPGQGAKGTAGGYILIMPFEENWKCLRIGSLHIKIWFLFLLKNHEV
jgi:hypothetical protein